MRENLYWIGGLDGVRIHKSSKVTPAMAAGITKRLWSMEDIAELVEARAPKPGKRGPYKEQST